ncbi:hypothetical protein Ahy_A03g015215 [Arachis hypogaea]|uniref:Uncharacterized protein n=1 Tax=Arachis hypogaea TaxID=3818 RepID=A0A445DZT3_ARAHY|nr:hypothetical protein Ahy_A03g015215 [Arachis hypogaea]
MVSTRAAMESRLEVLEKQMEEMREAQNCSMEAQNRSFELLSTNLLRQGGNGAGGRNGGDGEGSEGRGSDNNEGETEQRKFEPTRKLDIPIFSGDDANGWLVKMKRYYHYNTHDGIGESKGEIGSNTNGVTSIDTKYRSIGKSKYL